MPKKQRPKNTFGLSKPEGPLVSSSVRGAAMAGGAPSHPKNLHPLKCHEGSIVVSPGYEHHLAI
jgi:hypothetical protein